MDVDAVLASAPRRVRIEAEGGAVSLEVAEDLIAVHGGDPGPGAILILAGGEIAVEPLARHRAAELRKGMLGPVYRRTPGGGVAVPTGRVFARFAERERAEDHRVELEACGYRLDEVPAYSPHAAWVRHSSRQVGLALRDLDRLERLPALERVEPQFLAEAAKRM